MNWKELKGIGSDLNEVLSPDLPGVIEERNKKCRSKHDTSNFIVPPCILIH